MNNIYNINYFYNINLNRKKKKKICFNKIKNNIYIDIKMLFILLILVIINK